MYYSIMLNNILVLIPKKLIRYIDFYYDFFINKITSYNYDITIINEPSNVKLINIDKIVYIYIFQSLDMFKDIINNILNDIKFTGEIKLISTECTTCEKHQEIIESNINFIVNSSCRIRLYDYSNENLINYNRIFNLDMDILNLLEPNYHYLKEPISKDINIGTYLRFCNDDFKHNYLTGIKKKI